MQTRLSPTWEPITDAVAAGQVVAGVDEVGRGAWAGPVVAGAVILPPGVTLEGLNDSKLLTPLARRRLDREVRAAAVAVGLGWVSAAEVDLRGLSWAVQMSGLRALAGLEMEFDLVMLDGKHNYLADHHPARTLVKADQLVVPVAAASVVAKVARDRYLERLAGRYPGYGFERHKGYGTRAHAAALAELGACEEHRRSWGPLKVQVAK
jgi:ribonuclease HII